MMDYKQMTEIVKKEVEARREKKRRQMVIIRRVSFTVSSLCAAIIICFGAWNNEHIRKALRKDLITQPSEITDTESNTKTSDIQATTPHDSVATTTCVDDKYNNVSEQATAITTAPVQTDVVSTNTRSVTTNKNHDAQTTQVTSPVVTTAATATNPPVSVTTVSEYTPPIIVTETVKPPPDRTTATTSENETTTTTTVDQNSYAFRISFVDDVNLTKIDNVNAKLVRQRIEWIDSEHSRDVGDSLVVAEWNSSDSNPYTASFSKEYDIEYRYIVIVDDLPDGYSFYGKNSVELNIAGLLEEVKNIEILLTKEGTATTTTPLNGTYSLKLRVADIATNKNIANLDCELYCIQTKEVVAAWNTRDTEEIYIENLQYSFNKPDSYNGNITYAIRITNLPENYRFYYGKSREMYGICGFGLEEFANGTDLSCIAYLENTSADAT